MFKEETKEITIFIKETTKYYPKKRNVKNGVKKDRKATPVKKITEEEIFIYVLEKMEEIDVSILTILEFKSLWLAWKTWRNKNKKSSLYKEVENCKEDKEVVSIVYKKIIKKKG